MTTSHIWRDTDLCQSWFITSSWLHYQLSQLFLDWTKAFVQHSVVCCAHSSPEWIQEGIALSCKGDWRCDLNKLFVNQLLKICNEISEYFMYSGPCQWCQFPFERSILANNDKVNLKYIHEVSIFAFIPPVMENKYVCS